MGALIPVTNKNLNSYHNGVSLYAPLNYVDGGKANGIVFPRGRFDITVNGTVTNVQGTRGRYIEFDGSSGTNAVISPNSDGSLLTDLSNISNFTLTFKFILNDFNAVYSLISCFSSTDADNFFDLRLDNGAQKLGIVIFDGVGNDTSAFNNFVVSLDTEYNLWLYRNNGQWFITIDNESVAGGISYSNRANPNTNFRIGSRLDTSGNLNGAMGHVTMWNRVLSSTERSDYNSANSLLV